MSIVKITKKQHLDELLAEITLRMGRRPTQQDVLDLCVDLAHEHLDELIARLHPVPILDEAKLQRIRQMRKHISQMKWYDPDPTYYSSVDDADIYES